jgi:lipopolysaccharide/colanic/teichoic acid biosynthesis glycosyltransferase
VAYDRRDIFLGLRKCVHRRQHDRAIDAETVMKRALDLVIAFLAIVVLSPLLAIISLLVFASDWHSPFYRGSRVGRHGKPFRMIKFRSMRLGADKSGVMSTAGDDNRITVVGRFIRRYKLDELPQLLNIIRGEMSFVGPRPNVAPDVALYSADERHLLDARPGITDLSSIVFSDEGDILRGSTNPDRSYNLLIRPWKSRLGLHYIRHQSLRLDLELITLTAIAGFSKQRALAGVERILVRTHADPDLIRVSRRQEALKPSLPPGVQVDGWERHLTYTGAQ